MYDCQRPCELRQDVRRRLTGWEATHGGLGTTARGNRERNIYEDAIVRRYNKAVKDCLRIQNMELEAAYVTSR